MATANYVVNGPMQIQGNVGVGIEPSTVYELVIGGKKGIMVPVGTTSDAPVHANGVLRYNTSVSALQVSSAGVWKSIGIMQSGRVAPVNGTGTSNDVYVQMDVTQTKIADIFMYTGTTWIPLMSNINGTLTSLQSQITALSTLVNTLDFGEY